MGKTYIHTKDIFNLNDKTKIEKYYKVCRKAAIKCGLDVIDRPYYVLDLRGSKKCFIKYYCKTLFKCENVWKGVLRLVDIIFT